ncbi:hypothetical protein CLAIMM_03618 [Cladophialophora immunda]|nr:hypothetical protein CLAIMM_03618 [Cladophialophora immunda]
MAISLRDVSSALGFLTLIHFLYKIFLVVQFYLYSSDLSRYKPRTPGQGSRAWALVTGASDGIGKGLARELCARGFNVVVHGRNEEKLQRVKAELETEFQGCEVQLLVLDAADTRPGGFDTKVLDAVGGLRLTILVNNVGGPGGFKHGYCPLTDRSAGELDAVINLNARFMAQITRVLIPVLARDRAQPAAILSVSSGVEALPAPYLVAYSAAKGFVSRWSSSLAAELRVQGLDVDVMSVIVGRVITPKLGGDGGGGGVDDDGVAAAMEGLFSPNVATTAKACLGKLGCGYPVCTPYWPHGLQIGLMMRLPAWAVEKAMMAMVREEVARAEKTK